MSLVPLSIAPWLIEISQPTVSYLTLTLIYSSTTKAGIGGRKSIFTISCMHELITYINIYTYTYILPYLNIDIPYIGRSPSLSLNRLQDLPYLQLAR